MCNGIRKPHGLILSANEVSLVVHVRSTVCIHTIVYLTAAIKHPLLARHTARPGVISERLEWKAGAAATGARVAIANRGLGNAGLVFEAAKVYEGYVWAKGLSASGSTPLVVTLEDYKQNVTLATTTLSVPTASAGWVMLNFTLTPSRATGCVGIDAAAGTAKGIDCGNNISSIGYQCVQCDGQVALGLNKNGTVLLDYAYLQPGAWGRVGDLPVLASAAATLKKMGVRAIRQGGSYASQGNTEYYQWQKWTGPSWARASRTQIWGVSLLSGWGPFEMVDMCNALDIVPIITTTEQSTPQSFADLVEYCWGDASTPMGAQRIYKDQHPAPFNVTIFELGNEQYNSQYVEQVAAMEARASKLGMAGKLTYMFPDNGFLNSTDIAKAKKLSPRIDSSMVVDIHVGGGGAVEASQALFTEHEAEGLMFGAVNAETNAKSHTMQRALSEGTDLNDWFNAPEAGMGGRIKFRTASFCTGDATSFDYFDQGISFFLPNMTWLQPPGHVHSMISSTWQPHALNFTVQSAEPRAPYPYSAAVLSAQLSHDKTTLVLRLVNTLATSRKVALTLKGFDAKLTASMITLRADSLDAANPPGDPLLVSPTTTAFSFISAQPFTIEGFSVNAVVLTRR